jgi:hypothetical protein
MGPRQVPCRAAATIDAASPGYLWIRTAPGSALSQAINAAPEHLDFVTAA